MIPPNCRWPCALPVSAGALCYQNIVFALAVKFLCLILVAVGIANMWWAVFADVGVMVLAVLNATRMLRPIKPE